MIEKKGSRVLFGCCPLDDRDLLGELRLIN